MGADYIYATARVRSQEKNLLTGEQFRSMTESKNLDDICKVLQDAGYGNDTRALRPDNYEEVLKATEKEIFDDIRELSKENDAFLIFAYPADYHNLKVLVKAEALGLARNDILMEQGTIPPADMIRLVQERDKRFLTETMGKALEEAVDVHARTKDPQTIDHTMDKYCFAEICQTAERSKNKFVQGYVRLWIDTINLKTWARIRKMGRPWSGFSEVFLPGGNVDLPIFVNSYEEDYKQCAGRFDPYAIGPAVAAGGEAIEQTGSFTLLEKLCDNCLMEYLRQAKYITFGLEPLIAFLLSRQMEIRCIRILMTGKLAGMEPEVIRERLRETYE